MSLNDLTQTERLDRRAIDPVHLVDIELPGSITLRVCDRTGGYRYRYGSTVLLYEPYVSEVRGLGEIVASGDSSPNNADVQLVMLNRRWGSLDYLVQLHETASFDAAPVTIYELRLVDPEQIFATDVRTTLWKGAVEQLGQITRKTFVVSCGSRLFARRNNFGLEKVDRSVDAYAAPGDVGQYRNLAYGALEDVPCRCVKTGAIDLLESDVTSSSTTIVLQGLRRFEFLDSGSVQIGTEVIPYTGRSGDQLTGCTIASTHSADDPVCQVLDEIVYEVASHPVRKISAIRSDGYDNTADADAYTAQSGSVKTGYADRAVVVFPIDATVSKQINPDKDKHTHTQNSVAFRMPSAHTNSAVGATDGAKCYDRDRSAYGYLIDNASDSYFNFTLSATTGSEPIVSKVKIWFLLEAYSSTYGDQLRGNVTITYNGVTAGTIAHGTSLPKQWVSFELAATPDFIDYDAGYRITKDTTGETGTELRIYETYIEISTNGTKVSPTGSASLTNGANAYDGDASTYAYPSSSSNIRLTFAADSNGSVPAKITVRMCLATTGTDAGTMTITRDGKTLYTTSLASTITKQWFEWVDDDPYNRAADIVIAGRQYYASLRIYDAYIVVEEASTGIDPYEAVKQLTAETIRNGAHTAQLIVGDQVTCDFESYQDDASGTITGTANALIERPDHVIEHCLTVLAGLPDADIGSSFAASGTSFASDGYAFAFLVHDISADLQQLLTSLARQCRSAFCEWGGMFELVRHPDSTPTADFDLEDRDLAALPQFSYTPMSRVSNHITCFYRRWYASTKKTDDRVSRRIDPEAVSKGFGAEPLVATYGDADLKRELILNAVRDQAMAQDVLDFELTQSQQPRLQIELAAKWRAIQAGPGGTFAYTDPIFGLATYRILEFQADRVAQRITMKGEAI